KEVEISQTENLEPESQSEPELEPAYEAEADPAPEPEELILGETDESVEEEQQPMEEEVVEHLTEAVSEVENEVEEAVVDEPSATETINDVQVKHVTIENSTIHIGHLNVEQMPPSSEEAVVIEEKKEETDEVQPISTRSRVPFNVVMLKSDKQKLMTKQFVEQQLSMQSKQNKVDEVKQENMIHPTAQTDEANPELEDTVQQGNNDEAEAVNPATEPLQNEVRQVQENAEI